MKKTLIVTALLLVSTVVFGQKDNKHRENGEVRLEKLRSELALTDAQYASLKQITTKHFQQVSNARSDSVKTKAEKQEALKVLRVEREKQIEALLNTDQRIRYGELKREQRQKREARKTMRANDRHAELAKELNLTEDQLLKVKAANEAFIEKAKLARERLADDDVEKKEAIKKLRKEHEATMATIMSAEQLAKWKAMRKATMKKHKGRRN